MPQQVTIQPSTTPGGPTIITTVPAGTPRTVEELEALRSKRSELSDQLVSAAGRRKALADQLPTTDPSARAGIEARIKVLDDRIVRLEGEIDRTGDQLANTPPVVLAETQVPERLAGKIADEIVPITAILSLFVLAPMALAFARVMWKRASAPSRAAVTDVAAHQKLEHLQQAVDAIAVEVERISEGQRFVTRILNDRALGAGAAEPVRSPHRVASPSDRG